MGERPEFLPGITRSHGDLDPALGYFHPCANLQQLEAEGAAGGPGQICALQGDAAQGTDQDLGQGREPEAQLVGAQGVCRGAI